MVTQIILLGITSPRDRKKSMEYVNHYLSHNIRESHNQYPQGIIIRDANKDGNLLIIEKN